MRAHTHRLLCALRYGDEWGAQELLELVRFRSM
jgi:hypothetical protein